MAKTILRRIWNRLFLLALSFWLVVCLGYGIALTSVMQMPGKSWWHVLVVCIALQGSMRESWDMLKKSWNQGKT